MTGIDLGFVPVVRVPEARASQLEARAFTRAGVVHLPESAPPVESVATQALIAHELTHVLQQRALGARADEGGPLGALLEAQADAVERAHLGQERAPEQLQWPGDLQLPADLSWDLQAGFFTTPDEASSWTQDPQPGGPGPQRAPLDPALPPPTLDGPPPLGGGAMGDLPAELISDGIIALQYPEAPAAEQHTQDPHSESTGTEVALSPAEIARVAAEVRAGIAVPAVNPRDPELLDALAQGLYGRLRSSLRGELISDRERAGMLTEFH